MPLWFLVGLLVLTLDIIHAADEKGPIRQETSDGSIRSSFRWTRSVSGFAQPAIKRLIASAVEIQTKIRPRFKIFLKQGSVSDAVADFNRLKPTDVDKRLLATHASVGDVKIQFKLRDYRHNKAPTIQLSRHEGATPLKIVYI